MRPALVVVLLFVGLAFAGPTMLANGEPNRADTPAPITRADTTCFDPETTDGYSSHQFVEFQYTIGPETDVALYLTSCFDTDPDVNVMVNIDISICRSGGLCQCVASGLNPTDNNEMQCTPANTNILVSDIISEVQNEDRLVFRVYRADASDSTSTAVTLAIYECPTADFDPATPTECNEAPVVCSRTCLDDTSCSTSGRTGCTACAAPRFLEVVPGEEFGRCSYFCPDGQFEQTDEQTCQACDEGCLRCDENRCYECAETDEGGNPLFLNDSTCETADNCPPGRYANTDFNICVLCEEECAECESKEACTKCEDNFFLTASKECVRFCPDNSFENTVGEGENVCTACSSPCDDCQGSGTNDCITCIEGRWYLEGECVSDCGPDHFEGQDGFCGACNDVCEFGCDGPERTDCLADSK